MDKLSLKDTIGAIRRELAASILDAEGEDIRFEVGEVALEFAINVEKSAEAKTGVKFWVVEMGGNAGVSSSATHRVSLQLKPVSKDGAPILTGIREIPD